MSNGQVRALGFLPEWCTERKGKVMSVTEKSNQCPFRKEKLGRWSIIVGFVTALQSLSHVWLFGPLWTAARQISLPSPSPRVCSNSCPLGWRCHPTISSSVTPFPSCPQSFPASGSFPMSWLFASGGQSPGASASASALLMNIQGWFPLGWTGLISLLSKVHHYLCVPPACLLVSPISVPG